MLNENKKWFTEECIECGSAYSLEINEKLHEEQTQFQKIEIYSTKSSGNLLVIDGYIMLSERDNFIYHEMLAHPIIYCHPNPKNVVIVGGGDCGTLQEVAKHKKISSIVQVEIDQRVTELSEEYFPQLCSANNDSRVELIFEDAIEWFQKAEINSIDIIIVDSTDPIGPAKGLFSTPFYKNCFQALKQDGLLVQQSESPLIHLESIIEPMHQCMNQAGFSHTQLIYFPLPSYPTGWWSATLASQNKISHSNLIDTKEIATRYYNPEIHNACFATPQFLINK